MKTATIEELVVRDGEIHIRQISAEIADIFDCLLADNDIMIPDEDREGDEDEAPLYGCTYSDFEDGITEQLSEIVNGVRGSGADTTSAKEAIYGSFVGLLNQHSISVPGNKATLFVEMDKKIAELLSIAAKHPKLPVNDWEY